MRNIAFFSVCLVYLGGGQLQKHLQWSLDAKLLKAHAKGSRFPLQSLARVLQAENPMAQFTVACGLLAKSELQRTGKGGLARISAERQVQPQARLHASSRSALPFMQFGRPRPLSEGVEGLISSALNNDITGVEKWLGRGVAPNSVNFDSQTALHCAAEEGSVEVIEVLLNHMGPDSDRDNLGQTALHCAAKDGQARACAALLAGGANTEEQDGFGWTPLRWAVLNGNAETAAVLLKAGADGTTPVAGLSPLGLASAAGHASVLEALLDAGVREQPNDVSALTIAKSMGKDNVAALLQMLGWKDETLPQPPSPVRTEETMGFAAAPRPPTVASDTDSKTPTHDEHWLDQLDHMLSADPPNADWQSKEGPSSQSSERDMVGVATAVRVVDAAHLEDDGSIWDNAFASSTPLIVRGLGQPWVDKVPRSADELIQRWGKQTVDISWSPDEIYQRNVLHRHEAVGQQGQLEPPFHMSVPRQLMSVEQYAKLLPTHGVNEHFAVVQSDVGNLAAFDGLPSVPPLLSSLIGGEPAASNLWMCTPPKLSLLHYDVEDSVLLQLRGTKVFTVIDPGPLHGITVYPGTMPSAPMGRNGPGQYAAPSQAQSKFTAHFPFVNVTSPNLELHPLFAHAPVMRIEVKQGDALLLPAYWYHQVESFVDEERQGDFSINVAINYWFDGSKKFRQRDAKAAAKWPSQLHREFRRKLMVHA